MKFRATMTVEYDVPDSPEDLNERYGTTDPNEAARVDQEQFIDDPANFLFLSENNPVTITVEPAGSN